MRGRPFQPNNTMGRGRPPGSRNKRTLFAEEFQKNGLDAIRHCKLQALQGNQRALETWIAHLEAPCRPRHNRFRLPALKLPADWVQVLPAVMQAVASGKISAQDGEAIARIVQSQQQVIESIDFDKRLRAVELNTTGSPIQCDELTGKRDVNDGTEQVSVPDAADVTAQGQPSNGDVSMTTTVKPSSSSIQPGSTTQNPSDGEDR